MADQVGDKDERTLEKSKHQHIVIGAVAGSDLASQLGDPLPDGFFAEHDPAHALKLQLGPIGCPQDFRAHRGKIPQRSKRGFPGRALPWRKDP